MMSVQELFYGEAEPVWVISTTSSQVICYHAQPKPDQYVSEQRNFLRPNTPQRQNNFQQFASHRDSTSEMGHQYHQLRQSPPRQSLLHHHASHQHSKPLQPNSIPQNNLSPQITDRDRQSIDHQRRQGPLQQISPPFYHQNINQNVPSHNPSYPSAHQPSAPPMNAHVYHNEQENFSRYARADSQVVRLKVPMCCEACADRVMVSLTAIRGVQSVECEYRKEKVVVTGNAAPADILKACKKLFKRSEMWVDRYY